MNIIQQALKVMENEWQTPGDQLKSSQAAKDYARLRIGDEKEEVFGMYFLDCQSRVLAFEMMFRGSISESSVHARPLVRKILDYNAAKVILTHNHPSGDITPSAADIELTKHLKKVFAWIDCVLLDHIIVSPTGALSMIEKNYL